MRIHLAGLVALAAVAVAGCGSDPPGDRSTSDAISDTVTGNWDLVGGTVDGTEIDLAGMPPLTMSAYESGGRAALGGAAPCNDFGGAVSYDDGRLEVHEIASSAVGCEGRAGEVERAYYLAFQRIDHAAQRDGVSLVLTGPGVALTYRPMPVVPLDRILGVRWTLESADPTLPVHPDWTDGPPWVEYGADHSVVGSSGCRTFDTEWSIWRGDLIVQGGRGPTGICRPAFYATDAVTLPPLFQRVTVDGDRLLVTSRDGQTLTYVRASR